MKSLEVHINRTKLGKKKDQGILLPMDSLHVATIRGLCSVLPLAYVAPERLNAEMSIHMTYSLFISCKYIWCGTTKV